MRLLNRLQPLGLLGMRIALGVIMIAHGYPKVFGGMHGTVGFITKLGFPAWMAYLSAYTELFGGVLLLLGLFTRVAATGIFIDMVVAIAKVHWKNGLRGEGGYEFPMALAALGFALIFFGAGPIAIDALFGRRGAPRKAKG